jgi:hypothetical protein
MTLIEIFIWGFVGSVGAEIVELVCSLRGGARRLPRLYSRRVFYLARLLLALMGGGMAVAQRADKPMLAIQIGATTPIILQSFRSRRGKV